MESEDSDPSPSPSRRHKVVSQCRIESSTDSDSDAINANASKRKRTFVIDDSDRSSDTSGEVVRVRKRTGRPAVIRETDSDSSSCSSDESESDSGVAKASSAAAGESSDSDGQSEKCPICLKSFKLEEVATPESCDHTFCIECIKEWSKNVNTCPVDRQAYSLILVRSQINGKVVRQIPVEPPAPPEEPQAVLDDATFCEVCGRSDREDRMLLCDGCDLGYHLECLTPPLSDIPTGVWFCNDCGPTLMDQDFSVFLDEVELLLNDAADLPRPTGRRRRSSNRLIPRTRQSERVRGVVLENRARRTQETGGAVEPDPAPAPIDQPGTSAPARTRRTGANRRRRKRRASRRNPRIKITYQIDEETGQEYVFKTTISSYKKRKKRRSKKARLKARQAAMPKTAKTRLAEQLGLCGRKYNQQIIPEVRVSIAETTNLNHQRYQAGIPTLNMFGNRESLDYFSDEVGEEESGVLVARRSNAQDAALLRRERLKSVAVPITTMGRSFDILGSILESQEKFHSKNSVLSVGNDGSLKVETNNNNNSSKVLNDGDSAFKVRKAAGVASTASGGGGDGLKEGSGVAGGTGGGGGATSVSGSGGDNAGYSVSTTSSSSRDYAGESEGVGISMSVLEPENVDLNNSESELDIYSDIETVSTSNKVEEEEIKATTPMEALGSEDEANNSDIDLVIDTEKQEAQEAQDAHEAEIVTSTTNPLNETADQDDDDSEDGCPNFSIYSSESIKLAKSSDLQLIQEKIMINQSSEVEVGSSTSHEERGVSEAKLADSSKLDKANSSSSDSSDDDKVKKVPAGKSLGLYSDSDDEVVKIDKQQEKPFEIGDLKGMTEDISEEERSYTPCLDERVVFREGLEGLDTEAISDEEKNDFDEAHDGEVKVAHDGDALEINAKESELDLAKPEDFEEGEIVDKLKKLEEAKGKKEEVVDEVAAKGKEEEVVIKEKVVASGEVGDKSVKETTFKKITKTNRSRNYRDKDKDKEKSKSPGKDERERRRRKEKRKEIVRYNVRSLVSEKPSRLKDRFGRDRRSASSRSGSPFSPRRRSYSRNRSVGRRRTRSRSRSRRRRSSSRQRKRNRSKEKKRNKSRNRTRSPTPKRRKDWERRSRGWSPSPSRSHTPERQASPSWTPPRLIEKPVKPHNLTVILTNDSQKKKKEKRKADKRKKDAAASEQQTARKKRSKRDKTPPPSKEVFASGDNILVSVSFNKENDEREATVRKKRSDEPTKKKVKRSPKAKRKKTHDLSGVKPVAIIDLDRSPFRELTPSPNDVIVLSDSDNTEQVENSNPATETYPSGPKTPPEPQVKFTLNPKQPQIRNINNPLHEPDEAEMEAETQEDEARLNDALHKGPNTPPEPPNSPPSSPDAYDPFDPTKSRSPTPEPEQESGEKKHEEPQPQDASLTPRLQSPDRKSHTPPVLPEIQPADSQSNPSVTSPDPKRTPERTIGVVINQVVTQPASATKTISTSTPIPPTRLNTSTPSTKPSPAKIKLTTLNTTNGNPKATKKINRSNDSNDSNVDLESPYSPGPSDYEDLFEPPVEPTKSVSKPAKPKAAPSKPANTFDALFGSSPNSNAKKSSNPADKKKRTPRKIKSISVKLDEDMLRILDDVPNSAVELQVKDKFLKKLNRQERVVEEVKLVLKPHYNKKHINKEEYKDIMRRAVPKICHSRSGEINPKKIHNLIEAYVKKFRHSKKVSSSSSVNPQK